jgi:hypothetical protein
MSTQLCATWHTDSLEMVILPSTGALRCHNCCLDGDTSPEYFGYHHVYESRECFYVTDVHPCGASTLCVHLIC